MLYPNPITHPGFTFPSDNDKMPVSKLTWAPDADERDRIDFIYFYPNQDITPISSMILGPSRSIVKSQRIEENTEDYFITPKGIWPSDHKGVIATFRISLQQNRLFQFRAVLWGDTADLSDSSSFYYFYITSLSDIQIQCVGHIQSTRWAYRANTLDIQIQHLIHNSLITRPLNPVDKLLLLYLFSSIVETNSSTFEKQRFRQAKAMLYTL